MKNFITSLLKRDAKKHEQTLVTQQVISAASDVQSAAARFKETVEALLQENDRIRLNKGRG